MGCSVTAILCHRLLSPLVSPNAAAVINCLIILAFVRRLRLASPSNWSLVIWSNCIDIVFILFISSLLPKISIKKLIKKNTQRMIIHAMGNPQKNWSINYIDKLPIFDILFVYILSQKYISFEGCPV